MNPLEKGNFEEYQESTKEEYDRFVEKRNSHRLPRLFNKRTDQIPLDAICIDRTTIWGNPFRMRKESDRDEVCDKYEKWFYEPEQAQLRERAKKELAGKSLVCHCHPLRCHGNTLLAFLDKESEESQQMESSLRFRINVLEDGLLHLNCYSKAKTQLGRDLSHFAEIGFTYLDHGRFGSLESFWAWNACGRNKEYLKPLHGFKAKEEGRKLERVHRPNFMDEVEQAIRFKLEQNEWLLEQFKASTLPITHYYVGGSGLDQYPVFTPTTVWFEYFYGRLRDQLCGRLMGRGIRTIIAGSRTITDYRLVSDAVTDSQFNIREIVSGHARGVDQLGERYAKERNIPLKIFEADWKDQPRAGGIIRNEEMGEYADAGVLLWDNKSPGTRHMLEYLRKEGKSVYLVTIPSSK